MVPGSPLHVSPSRSKRKVIRNRQRQPTIIIQYDRIIVAATAAHLGPLHHVCLFVWVFVFVFESRSTGGCTTERKNVVTQ